MKACGCRAGEAVCGRGAVGGAADVPVAGGERGGGAVFACRGLMGENGRERRRGRGDRYFIRQIKSCS